MWTSLLALAALAAFDGYRPPIDAPPGCQLTHYLADGRRIETTGAGRSVGNEDAAVNAQSRAGAASVSSSSARARATTSGGGSSSASAVAVGPGRKITHTEDQSGCRIVIDDRAAGEHP